MLRITNLLKRGKNNATENLKHQRRSYELHVLLPDLRLSSYWCCVSGKHWSIEQRGEQQVLSFNKSFKTKKGPDLKIFFSRQSIDTATGNNATENAVLLAPLRSSKGAQEYVLPADIDLNDFTSLLIHCEAYSVLWGGTNL